MILSASRRTDIPAFYFEWFLNRIKEGYVLVPNPRNANRLGRVELSPDHVDCIVFWTKNPGPMLDQLKLLDRMGYAYYVQFTLTPYDRAVELHVPPKEQLVRVFRTLSSRIGAVRSVWRYDPIVIDDRHSVAWHTEKFASLCQKLSGATERCVISFVDPYPRAGNRYRALTRDEMTAVAQSLSAVAKAYGITLTTCAEEIDLSHHGIEHGSCIDQSLIERIVGGPIAAKRDANQRAACACIESVDIGVYDTCSHGCSYCYATVSPKTLLRRVQAHDPMAPMLTGYPTGPELITDRTAPSQKSSQLKLY